MRRRAGSVHARKWIVLFLFLFLAHAWIQAANAFDAIYAFGDSLTDTGRDPAEPAAAYYQGRYSNGPLWVEYFSQTIGLEYRPENNFAESGAQTPEMLAQVNRFVPSRDLQNALFVVWAGANDFVFNLLKNGLSDDAWNEQINAAANNLSNAVVTLHQKGAVTIAVPNLADLSKTPAAAIVPFAFRPFFRGKLIQLNAGLSNALNQIESSRTNLNLIRVDVFNTFERILQNPSSFGFTKVDIDALSDTGLADKRFDGPGQNYLFWDLLHPTTKAHLIIAELFGQALATDSQPKLVVTRTGAELTLRATLLQASKNYSLQKSADLKTWSEVQTFTAPGLTQDLSLETAREPIGFFKLVEK